jgi:uncharacterized protein YgiM (DUF1202 family)
MKQTGTHGLSKAALTLFSAIASMIVTSSAVFAAPPVAGRAKGNAPIFPYSVELFDVDAGAGYRLNLRTGPGTGYKSITLLTNGTRLESYGERSDDGWVKVWTPNGTDGWVFSRYLAYPNSPHSYDAVRVTANVLNVRSGPGTNYKKIGALSYGELAEVIKISGNGWAYVNDRRSFKGWISLDYTEGVTLND